MTPVVLSTELYGDSPAIATRVDSAGLVVEVAMPLLLGSVVTVRFGGPGPAELVPVERVLGGSSCTDAGVPREIACLRTIDRVLDKSLAPSSKVRILVSVSNHRRSRATATSGEPVTITAKYAATCPVCNSAIAPGQKIEWSKGTKARHTACAGKTATSAPRTYGQRIEASRRSWGARRGMGSGHGQAASVRGYSSYCTDNASCRCYDCAS